MSLSYEQFIMASEESDKLMKRLIRLFGYNHAAICDHYECTHLYNKNINNMTSDEELHEIHAKFLQWQESILAFFAENGVVFDDKQIKNLFSENRMTGTMYFLGILIDIDSGIDKYRAAMLDFLKKHKAEQ